MVSDIYMFDLETFKWEKVSQSSEDDIPQARYFHSADTCACPLLSSPACYKPHVTSRAEPLDHLRWNGHQATVGEP